MKKCKLCNQNLEFKNFSKNSKNEDLLQNWCKSCDKQKKINYPSQSKDKMKEYFAVKYIQEKEKRSYYAKEKYLENREEILNKAKAYAEKTKETKAEYDKRYREQNRQKIAEYKKQWANENTETIAEKMRIYRKENADKLALEKSQYAKNNRVKINTKASVYNKHRRATDPLFRLIRNTRNMVSRYMLGSKDRRTQEIVGCTFEELKLHIEIQFTDGMT